MSDLLRELARAKAAFQLRALETIMGLPTSGIAARSGETAETGSTEGKSPTGEAGDAQNTVS